MKLTEEQIELGAKFLAASNTGLIGVTYKIPTTKGQIRSTYSMISGDYQAETGKGLHEELEMWKEIIEKDQEKYMEEFKNEIPFIFE